MRLRTLDDLYHFSPELVDELTSAMARGRRIWCACVDGDVASVAYAPWRSERYFDVSVDTAPNYRGLGLGTMVAAALIREERGHGREPVWGAEVDNVASLRMASRLGFTQVGELWVIA